MRAGRRSRYGKNLPVGAKGAIVRPGSPRGRAVKSLACRCTLVHGKHLSTSFYPSMPTPRTAAPAQPPVPDAAVPANYEVALHELEALIARMDAGEMPLDELLVSYQRGAVLLQFCRDKLQAVEDQVKVLEDGVLKPWKNA
jgi:exodeoxyribonuclease VII small subunit